MLIPAQEPIIHWPTNETLRKWSELGKKQALAMPSKEIEIVAYFD